MKPIVVLNTTRCKDVVTTKKALEDAGYIVIALVGDDATTVYYPPS